MACAWCVELAHQKGSHRGLSSRRRKPWLSESSSLRVDGVWDTEDADPLPCGFPGLVAGILFHLRVGPSCHKSISSQIPPSPLSVPPEWGHLLRASLPHLSASQLYQGLAWVSKWTLIHQSSSGRSQGGVEVTESKKKQQVGGRQQRWAVRSGLQSGSVWKTGEGLETD